MKNGDIDMLSEVVEDLRDVRAELRRLKKQVTKAQRDAEQLISEGGDQWEESFMLEEVMRELEPLLGQPSQVLKALRTRKITPEQADAAARELSNDCSDLEETLAGIRVPDPRK